jgi:phosphoenolpyruvate carboxykinase (GTP)
LPRSTRTVRGKLYSKQFALYVDNVVAPIDLQREAYSQAEDTPKKLFEAYETQREELQALKARYGPIVSAEKPIEAGG